MKNVIAALGISLLGMSFYGCSDSDRNRESSRDKPIVQSASERMSGTAKKAKEAGKDMREEACRMVDGDLECGIERLQRDAEDSTK